MRYSILIILIIITSNFKGLAQPAPHKGTLLFNLTEKEHTGSYVKAEDFKTKKIQVLSFTEESELTYDTVNKAFSFTTIGNEIKSFAIIYKNKTIFIDYPSLRSSIVKIIMPIPLEDMSFSFYNSYIYDAIHSNRDSNPLIVFKLCQGCFISQRYQMDGERKKQLLDKISQLKNIELKE